MHDDPRADPFRPSGLPDPDRQPEFYSGVPAKRLVAFVVDSILIGLITLVAVPFTMFTALFYLPFLYALVAFVYRSASLARSSATPGMRLMAIEFRDRDGARFDLAHALLHTLGLVISLGTIAVQAVSIVLMLTSARAQGLTDMILGTAAINRPADAP